MLRLISVKSRILFFVFVNISSILLCNCGTIASVAVPVALAVATKNTSALASSAGIAFADKTTATSVGPNGATFQNPYLTANSGAGGTQANFNNGSVSANINSSAGISGIGGGLQTASVSHNITTLEFMSNDHTGWQTLQNYRRDGWNIINYEVMSYGAIRLTLFNQRKSQIPSSK